MISSEVQRTLVKSPPELWAELGDPASLARHLGELGEIRITRAEPEKLVEWEAESAKGTVAMKGSGWGTKVTLTASRELTPPQPAPAPEEEPAVDDQPSSSGNELQDQPFSGGDEPQDSEEIAVTAAERFGHEHSAALLGSDLERATEREPETEPDEQSIAEPEPESDVPTPDIQESRRGLFARLFGFGRRRPPASASASASASEISAQAPASLEPATTAAEAADHLSTAANAGATPTNALTQANALTPVADTSAEPDEGNEPAELKISTAIASVETEVDEAQPLAEADSPIDLAAELKAAEEEVEAILTGVLDRLGAAHHRPFSRS